MSEPNPFERWPGYDVQSWEERFEELDRRYQNLKYGFEALYASTWGMPYRSSVRLPNGTPIQVVRR